MSLTSLVILAICTETVITAIKDGVSGGIKWQMVVSWVIGCVVAVAYNADILASEGLKSSIPYVGNIITGIAIGRGSNFFFDLLASIKSGRTITAVEPEAQKQV